MPDTTEKLLSDLNDNDFRVKWYNVANNPLIKNSDVVGVLIAALQNSNVIVRKNAAWTLGELKDFSAVPYLIDAMKDQDLYVQEQVVKTLAKVCKNSIHPLLSALEDDAPEIRGNSASVLGEIGDTVAVDLLIGLMTDEVATVRENAMEAVLKMGELDPIVLALKSSDPGERSRTAWALTMVKDTDAVKTLTDAMQSTDLDIRDKIEWAMVRIKSPAVEPLIELIGNSDSGVEKSAIRALGKIKDTRAIEPLIEVLRTGDSSNKYYVATALKTITGKSFGKDPIRWNKWWVRNKITSRYRTR